MRRRRGRRGFTLLEVVVGLALLELGLLGAAGLVALSARSLGRARAAQWRAGALAEVADSLALHGVADAGRRRLPGGRVEWRVEGRPGEALVVLTLSAHRAGDSTALEARAVLPAAAAPAGAP